MRIRAILWESRQRRPFGARDFLRFLILAIGALALGSLVTLSLCHGDESEGVPKFRRLLLTPERLPEELKRVEDGVLVRLPAAEFEALVERAAKAGTRKAGPRLLQARYHAVLKEECLLGEGQWKLVHAGSGPALLPMEPFNLALRQARWENGDALIAAFDGKTPALLVEAPGERTVSLDWSARGEAGPEGLQFHLEMPACPVALLEVDVPAGRAVAVLDDGALVSGPHEAETAELRRWKIVCGGRLRAERQRVDFRVLAADRPAAAEPRTLFVRQKTTQKLNPDGLDAVFELAVDGLPRDMRELVCECDPELRLRDVTGPAVASWSFHAGAAGKPSRLTIRLREAVRAGTWQVRCLAPLNHEPSPASGPVAWRSPGLRLLQSVPRGETLALWLHPDLRVEHWDAGGFRIEASTVDRSTGAQVLTLSGGGLNPLRRPAAQLQAYGVEFSTQQLTWWRCDAAGMNLTVQIGWDVSQGQLFQLRVRLPDEWDVDKVEMTPSALLGDWHVRKDGGKATLFVELTGPLAATSRLSGSSRGRLPALTVQLRSSQPFPHGGKTLAFPDAVPLGARYRQGALALDCDEQLFHLDVQTAAERAEPESEGPWEQKIPGYYYRYQGQPIHGTIHVRPRPPRLRAKCDSDVFVASGEAVLETHLLVESEVGSPNAIELLFSSGDGGPWQWLNEASPRGEDASVPRVRRAERVYPNELSALLQLVAASHPLQAAVIPAAQPAGERWRLTLTRPLHSREPLRLRARRRLQPRDNLWDVPLPVVLGADRMEGEVVLHLAGGDLVHVHPVGLREAASAADKSATPWRTFRYGQSEVRLTLSGQPLASERPTEAAIEDAQLITYVGDNGVLRHHFSFRVANWTERALPLRLPPGTRPWAVQVDGRWLPRLIPAEAESEEGKPIELALPVPARGDAVPGDGLHRFEVVYTATLPSWTFWQTLDAAAPHLPVAPLAFRRVWRLHPKLAPLFPRRYQSLPGTAAKAALPALPRHAGDLFHLPGPLARFDPLEEDQSASVREAIERAAGVVRAHHAEKTLSLGEVVSETSFTHLKDRYCLIIDALALREAGIGAETPVTVRPPSADESDPPWTECGLIAVPGRSAILLTTTSGRGAALREPLGDDVESALEEAVRRGQDASGRFYSALTWLHPERAVALAGTTGQWPLEHGVAENAWSEWEPAAGGEKEPLIVVRRDLVAALGLGLALLVVLGTRLARRRTVRWRSTFLLLALAVLGLGVVWLPAALRDLAWWPLLAAASVAAWGYISILIRKTASRASLSSPSKNAASAAAVTGMVLLGTLGWHGRAAGPAPVEVYLVPGPADAPEKQAVLAPAHFIERLKALAQPVPLVSGGPRTVLLDAFYEGQLVEGGKQAEFSAVFSAHGLSEEPSTLLLPLSGVQLTGEVLLDGARAAPLALPVPQAGYSIPVRGRGRHKIEVRFRVPVIGTDEDRNVLFTAPPLVRSRLSWRIPDGALEPQVLVKNGGQWTLRDASGQRLEADLGAAPLPVHLHWHQPRHPARVSYQAAYLWDLGVEASSLTGWLRYRVPQGAVKTLAIDLPAELEVSSARARRTVSASRPPWWTRVRLRDWHITRAGGKRTLHLGFPCPISGDFQVTLELLPRAPLTSPASLPLPMPRGAAAAGPHYLAYRTQSGLAAQRATSQNLTRIGAKQFAPDWPGEPRLEANFRGIAYRIAANQPPRLVLRLERTPPAIQGDVDVTVQAGAQRAEIDVDAEVQAPNRDLAAVEWNLPPHCTIRALTGEDVRTWKQTGSRLLVWLNRTAATTHMHMKAWLTLQQRDGHSSLELSGLLLSHADKQHTRLRLVPSGEVVLAELQRRNLRAVSPDGSVGGTRRSSGSERVFETWDLSYRLNCQVQSGTKPAARVLTLAEVDDRELRFTTTVDYTVRSGELRHVRLRLRNWEEAKVEVDAENVALMAGPRRVMGERSWSLPLKPGVRGHYRVTLRGSIPLDQAAVGVPMPDLLVQDAERADYFVAVAGGELAGQANGALQALPSPQQALQSAWPNAAQRIEQSGGQVWRVGGSEWQLHLLPHARTLEPAPVRVYLLEQSAAVVDGKRWLHEARCWLRHGAYADLNLVFTAPARILAASVDGVEVTPLQAGSARAWMPLPGRPGVRCVRLRWLYESPEPLDRPNLTAPQLVDAVKGPILSTLLVPPGWQASLAGVTGWQGAKREAMLALWRAEGQLHICEDLAKQQKAGGVLDARTAAGQRFELYRRQALHALDVGADRGGTVGPQGQSLGRWLEDLQAKYRSLELVNRTANSPSPSSALDLGYSMPVLEGAGGSPVSWLAPPPGEPLSIPLNSVETQRAHHALAITGAWLGGLFVLWMMTFVPFVHTRLHRFWPEQLALLGLLGWHLAGLTSIVGGLLLAAMCGRLVLLMRAIRRLRFGVVESGNEPEA